MTHTPEAIEAESARLRAQLVAVGADIRHSADPSVVMDAAKDSFKRRVEETPAFLKENATPIGMLLLGGAAAVAMTGMFSRRSGTVPRVPSKVVKSPPIVVESAVERTQPTAKSQVRAALLSAVGLGFGYLAGMFVPATSTEERLLGEPKAMLSQHLNQLVNRNAEALKTSAVNAFGVSRLSGMTLVAIALLAEVFGIASAQAKRDAA